MRHSCCVILIGVAFLLASCTSPIPLPSPIYGAIPTNPPPFSPSPSPAPTISPTPTPALFAVTQIAQIGKGEPARIAYSPDGKLFAVATSVGIYIYKVETMEEFRFIETEARNDSIAFSPDGRTLAGGSDEPDNMVGLWMVSTGQLLHTLQGHTGKILSVAFDPSGQTLASASGDGTTRLWDVTTGKLLSVDKEGGGSVVVFSPDGTLLADAGVNVRLLDVKTGELIRTFNGDVVAISPNGRILASGASYGLGLDGKTVWLWDISTGKLLRTIKGAEYVSKLIFSPDGGMLAGSSREVWLWNTINGQLMRKIKGSRDMAFSPNGQTLASIDNVGNVQLWDAKTGQLLHSLDGYTQIMTSVAFSPDGQTLAAGNGDGSIYLWDVSITPSSGAIPFLRALEGHTSRVYKVAFSSDNRSLVSGGDDKTVRLWVYRTGEQSSVETGHTGRVMGVAFNPDGRRYLSGSEDMTVRLWRTDSRGEFGLIQQGSAVDSVASSSDGHTIAAGGSSPDFAIWMWNIDTLQLLRTLVGHTNSVLGVDFSPNGLTLASGGADHTVRIWDAANGQPICTLEGHTASVESVRFSPDGYILASSSQDTTIRLWDVATCQPLITLRGHTDIVWDIAFSPDGRMLASASHDGTVRLWKVERP